MGARSAPFERQWYAKVPSRISLCRYSGKLPPPHFVQGRSRLLLLGKATPCFITARFLLSRIVFLSADATFQTNLPRARRKASLSPPLPLRGKTRKRYRFAMVYVGPIRSARFLDSVAATQISAESAEPFGLVILAGSNLLRLHFIKEPHSAGPTSPLECRGRLPLFVALYKRWSHRPATLQRFPVQRLPRPTGLPAHCFSQSSATAIAVAKASLKQSSPTLNPRPGRSAKSGRPTTLEGKGRAYKNITFQGTPSPSPPVKISTEVLQESLYFE